jgi:molecular chaperone GrpE
MSEETEQEMPEASIADFAKNAEAGQDSVAALRAEMESLRDQRLRALAELENVRRRADRDKQEASQYAVTKFARDMVSIADNFSRALNACPAPLKEAADPQIKAVLEGVEATDRQLMATLERYGVKPVSTENGKFDPNLHQAIAEVPGNGKPAGAIVDVVQSGYTIGDRLLRPAMVTVARRDEAPASVNTKA